ncbi:hypothetical protein IW140_003358 [Coemansia sp. RSA 1813]|nr:hypothetical protein EV178_001854 [Coemansia sp. RSA 1646]KAJ1766113.1 hypothetical protein LPJ74_006035 [Coemansia sp. RSA 1843]KAJ2214062.1 hypothetical protein EV179_003306 [Coemansia sp. RSA 487]KAJ2569138.1 hypothetical protein IW140_003358 [Coemansia sp. RSA 1813]
MLKAFSKVFHKTPPQGAPDDLQPEDFAHAQVTADPRQHIKRASGIRLRQQTPNSAGLGIHSPTVPQNSTGGGQIVVVSPNRNPGSSGGGGGRLAWPHMTEGAYPAGQPNKRVSLHHRMEQQLVQPRLHVKGPGQGTDGRFALTKDNLDWHLRMIPPVKESKYDRILKYIEMQQQAVAAAADLAPQQNHSDIDTSLLMGGGPMNNGPNESQQQQQQQQQQQRANARIHYGVPAGGTTPMLIPMQPYQQQQQQPLQQYGMSGVLLAPPLADREITKTAPYFHAVGGSHMDAIPPHMGGHPLNNGVSTAQKRTADPQPLTIDGHKDSEDDDTPLAAINASTNSRLPPPPRLTIPPHTGFEKYAAAAYNSGDNDNEELPEAVVPGSGFRASIASFQSNMAVNFNTEPTARMSFSNSNPRSASIFESHYRTTPVPRSPTVLETLAHHMSTNSGSGHHSSFPSAKIQNRPSLDAITPTSPDKKHSSGDSAVEASPLDVPSAAIRRQQQRQSVVVAKHTGVDGDDDTQLLAKQRPMSSSAALQARDSISMLLKNSFTLDHPTSEDGSDTSRQVPNDQTDANGHEKQYIRNNPNDLGTLESAEQGSDSDSSIALRVVNPSSVHGSDECSNNKNFDSDQVVPAANHVGANNTTNNYDDEDDDKPLMSLPRPQKETQQRPSLYISTNPNQKPPAQPTKDNTGRNSTSVIDSDDDDDDQPLSSLLLQPNTTSDELGSLPLPMPRHVVDPDAVANMDDMVNETAVPLRKSIGEQPVSPLGPRGASVRKESSLSRSFRMSDHNDEPAEGTAGYIRSRMPAKRRSNLSTCLDIGDETGRIGQLSLPRDLAMNRDPIIEHDSESDDGSNSRSNAPSPQQVADYAEEMGRPWARHSEYNPSTTSLGSHRKTQRGSTLGQQLTEEMHQLRMGLARAQRDNDRQSWQPGNNAPLAQQPWLRKENALSDTALPHKLETLQKLTAGAANANHSSTAGGPGNNSFLDALAAAELGAEAPKMVSSWSFTDNQRPHSIQPQRRSRWFGKGNGLPANNSSNTNIPLHAPPSDDTHANHGSSSFSSRFNAKLGKLKKTLKPAAGTPV